ncbi:MAG: Tol-Pal system beta propeller repeat protein TolB [Geminicoccaceae bacterium]|nr:Tol-Pal system beta propeller repeat protein TolB [Geminicoccaceae bacterium]MDW8123357.1 Tol-Pal system beta propeller repeat protein TolB [Geminicoccaceae bacterium]
MNPSIPLRRRALLAGTVAFAGGVFARRLAQAQLHLDITRGFVEPMPIAVSPFAGDGPAAREQGEAIAQVVSADLDSSGLFRTLDRRAYIQGPEELRGVPRFADWRQINAQALVTGVVRSPEPLVVEFRLWDVFGGTQLRGLRLDAPSSAWRRVAHKIADAVYERLTGESGYFDTKIAYIAETGPATRRIKRVAVMDQDGANHAFLTDGSQLVLTPRLSPDVTRIAYLVFRHPAPRVVMRELASGREIVLGEFPGMSFAPRFSPDGRSLLVSIAQEGNTDLFRFDLVTRQLRRLTDGAAIDTSPSYSPDGTKIAFNSDRGGSPQLYVMNADGSGVRRISFGSGRYGEPEWSPRGDLIAFSKLDKGFFHIGVMKPDGSDERLLTRNYQDESPTWSPNGRVILFSRQDRAGGRTRLFSIDITGYNQREIPTPLDASDPNWSALLP